MARKNTLFEVDIAKENPLITIVKHGKIPVIQVNDGIPFQNKKVEYWYKPINDKEETIQSSNNLIMKHKEKGLHNITYCNIGGFHGMYFSHWLHSLENINIGYIEPEELVYDKTSESFISAKRKFESVKNAWYSLLKKENEEDIVYGKWSWFNEHYADFQEVWCDSKNIKKVITITPDECISLLPYVDNGYLSLCCVEDIFHEMDKKLDDKYLSHIEETNLNEEWILKCERESKLGDWSDRKTHTFDYFWDFVEFFDGYKKKALEEFYNFYSGRDYKYPNGYFKRLKDSIRYFYSYFKHYKSHNKDIIACNDVGDFWFSEQYLRIILSNQFKTSKIILRDGQLHLYNGMYVYDHCETEEFFLNNIRPMMYEFLEIFKVYCDVFRPFFSIECPDILRHMEKYKEIEEALQERNITYVVNDMEHIIVFTNEEFRLEYNLILRDAVVEVKDLERPFYNVDNLPVKYRSERINEIMEIFKMVDEEPANV